MRPAEPVSTLHQALLPARTCWMALDLVGMRLTPRDQRLTPRDQRLTLAVAWRDLGLQGSRPWTGPLLRTSAPALRRHGRLTLAGGDPSLWSPLADGPLAPSRSLPGGVPPLGSAPTWASGVVRSSRSAGAPFPLAPRGAAPAFAADRAGRCSSPRWAPASWRRRTSTARARRAARLSGAGAVPSQGRPSCGGRGMERIPSNDESGAQQEVGMYWRLPSGSSSTHCPCSR